MPFARANGASLYYEATGTGFPLVFVHEFGGDYRSWEPQVRYFSLRYLCVTYNARGYPPSDVPKEQSAYSQEIATDDLVSVLRHLRVPSAHIVGLSMGGFATLYLGIRHGQVARSLVVAGCGYGSMPAQRANWQADSEALARLFETEGAEVAAKHDPTRCSKGASFRHGLGSRTAKNDDSYADHRWRHGRSLYRAQHVSEANHPLSTALRASPLRPPGEPGRAGPVQPDRGQLPRDG